MKYAYAIEVLRDAIEEAKHDIRFLERTKKDHVVDPSLVPLCSSRIAELKKAIEVLNS